MFSSSFVDMKVWSDPFQPRNEWIFSLIDTAGYVV